MKKSNKFVPKAEQFFFAPRIERVVNKSKILNNGEVVAGQVVSQVSSHQDIVLFWCEYSNSSVVKSYIVKVLTQLELEFDYVNQVPIYHNTKETQFELADPMVIADFRSEIDLLYLSRRPNLVENEIVVVPEEMLSSVLRLIKP